MENNFEGGNLIRLWYRYCHDGLTRWTWIDYIKEQNTLKRNWFINHSEACFEYS